MKPLIRPLLIALVLAALAAGCTVVHPWQRGTLAHPCMQLEGDLGAWFLTHKRQVREGTAGGEEAAGGGCGCI